MKLCWLTDIHLNFLHDEERRYFYQELKKAEFDAIAITGDIAEAPSICEILKEMDDQLSCPIYFVLGNHDYYRGNVEKVRSDVATLCEQHKNLYWMATAGEIKTSDDAALVGHDGWADGRYGDYENTRIVLNDSRLIKDLWTARTLGKNQLGAKMQELADADAKELEQQLIMSVAQNYSRIIILTHVPHFEGAAWHEGQLSDKNWLPFFSSKAMGDVLLKVADKNPEINFLVLCGHTHSEGEYKASDNLFVKTGRAEYYHPEFIEILEV